MAQFTVTRIKEGYLIQGTCGSEESARKVFQGPARGYHKEGSSVHWMEYYECNLNKVARELQKLGHTLVVGEA
jgi:hypothetical protein